MALDLASVQQTKNNLEKELTMLNTEKEILVQQVENVLKEKADLETKIEANDQKIEDLQKANHELEKKYDELNEITNEQDNGLLTRQNEVHALKHEVKSKLTFSII